MGQITRIADYKEYKKQLDDELQRTTEGFFKIGYLLKLARDTNVLEGSGYENVTEFAKKEYNLEKSQVSRFIAINERFADPEQSDRLKETYQGFGVAKLAIMLQLPDEINEELSPEFSKTEVQAIRDEIAEEYKVSDIERMLEEVPQEIAQADSLIERAIVALGKQEPELYRTIQGTAKRSGGIDVERLKDDMAPNEEAIYSIRIPADGRMLLSIKIDGKNTLTNVRSGEKTAHTWQEIADAWEHTMNMDEEAEKSWEEQYKEDWPIEKKGEVAPVQQRKQEQKNQSKVVREKNETKVKEETKTSQEKSTPEPKREEQKEEPSATETRIEQKEQLPGQMEVKDYPEMLPDDVDTSEKKEDRKSETAIQESIKREISRLKNNVEMKKWEQALIDVQEIEFKITRAKEMEENEEE